MAETGEKGSLGTVVLGQPADGFSEAPRAERVDQGGPYAGVEQAL